ncbi:MAG: hypothetical protein VB071_03970 [Lawsonibacter sp.]|nr:hypothetical protein [Lawsonibacter sp.]
MKKSKDFALTVIGLVLLAIGLYLAKTVSNPQGIMKALPYVLIGVGCGAFGQGMGNIIARKAVKNAPEIEKQMEIARKDERNVAIANRSKANAYDIMVYVYSALMLAFALMGTDMAVILLLVFAYLFIVGCSIYYRCKYNKEM